MKTVKSHHHVLVLIAILLTLGGTRGRAADLITNGHYDLNVAFSNNVGWAFNWYNFADGSRVSLNQIDMGMTEAARTVVPASGFSDLGAAPGNPVWILPQTQNPDITFLGYRTDDIDPTEITALFGTAFIGLKVTEVRGSGPDRGGFFSAYQTGLGSPVFQYTSANGLDNGDVVAPIPLGAHAHFNWAFTKPGEYQVKFEAEGDHKTGGVTNGSGAFTFFVPGGMTNLHILDSGHLSFDLGFNGSDLELLIGGDVEGIPNADANKTRSPEEALFYDQASDIQLTVPATGFDFLGNPGATIWAFPQSSDPNTIFLGLNSEGVTNGTLLNDAFEMRLINVDGPTNGNFSFFQVDAFGAANLFMNSGDGVDPSVDKHVIGANGHDHYFWAFTKTGRYRVSLQLAATNTSGTPITSRVFETQFGIGDLPGFRDDDGNGIDDHWEARHGFTTPADPNADPDNDMKSNLKEFLFDTDPQTSDTTEPVFRITHDVCNSVSLEIDTKEGRQYRLMYSEDLRTWLPGSEKILGQRTRLLFLDDGNGLIQTPPTNRFYRMDISSPR
ncbi:MAG: choice-of-anchor M domain-containing protein [Limisphaerales bacterium]